MMKKQLLHLSSIIVLMMISCASLTAMGQDKAYPSLCQDEPVKTAARPQFSAPTRPVPMSPRIGDVNIDGRISIDDVTTLIDQLLTGSTVYSANADVDYDGRISIGDVTELIDMLLKGETVYNYGKALYDLNEIYASMRTAGWSTTGNTHQAFGISAYNLMAEVMGDDMIMGALGSGWFWYDASYNVKGRYTSTMWRSHDLWTAYYTWIANANYILAASTSMNGSAEEINYVKGQAYAIRAYGYFMLAQSFARTYKGHESDPGVPIYNGMVFNGSTNQPRATVAQVYAQIDADITQAIDLLNGTTQMVPDHMGYAVALGLQSRVALVEEDWETALTAAVNAISASGKSIQDVSDFIGLNDAYAGNVMWGADIPADQVGMYASLWAHMSTNYAYGEFAPKQISKWLYDKMSDSDTRLNWWKPNTTSVGSDAPVQQKFEAADGTQWNGDYIWMRVEEMYLNAAEAACRLGRVTPAKGYLNALMNKRDPNYSCTKTGTGLGALTTDETGSLLEEILIQRRIELWGEDGRIYTIRRLRQGFERPVESGWPTALVLSSRSLEDPESYPWILTIPVSEFSGNASMNINYNQNPLGDYPIDLNTSTGPQNITFEQAEYSETTAQVTFNYDVTLRRSNTNGSYQCVVVIGDAEGVTLQTSIAYFSEGANTATVSFVLSNLELGHTYTRVLSLCPYDEANGTTGGRITSTRIEVNCENVNSAGQHISFESASNEFLAEGTSGTFNVKLTRRVADGEYRAVVSLEDAPENMSLNDNNIVFNDGELTAEAEIYCYSIAPTGTYSGVLKLSDADIATAVPLVPQITSATVKVIGPMGEGWIDAGSCTFTDYTWEDGYTAINVPVLNKEGTNKYCIVSPLAHVYTSSYSYGEGDTSNWFFYLNADGSISIDEGESLNYWGYMAYYSSAYADRCYINQDGNTYDVNFLLKQGSELYIGGRFVFTWDR